MNVPFRIPMVVVSLDGSCRLLKTRVVKSSKRSTINITYSVIWHEKVFLPSHVYEITSLHGFVIERIGIKIFSVLIKWLKFILGNRDSRSEYFERIDITHYSHLPNVSCRHPRPHPIFSSKMGIFYWLFHHQKT